MQHNGWAHALKVTADGTGLVGHAGAVLLRKAADQAGLTAGLSAAVRRKGASPLLDRIARARAKARAHAWTLIEGTPAGFPWLVIAGKTLAGWVVIDMDATLVTAYSDKEGAAPTWKKGYGFHPLAAWAANTRECLAMLLRPGNAGSNTFTDHKEVLTAALRQVPARLRRQVLPEEIGRAHV